MRFPLTILTEFLDNRLGSPERKWQARSLVNGKRWGIVFIHARKGDADEQCSYCGEWFPRPVELYHAEADCVDLTCEPKDGDAK